MTEIQTALTQLPSDPGVYLYYNSTKKVIYVGKAVNLKNRVKSYFQSFAQTWPQNPSLSCKHCLPRDHQSRKRNRSFTLRSRTY
ncbi:MAG: hypothetical protein KatS3mg087_0666 [Patescibacteria group bacterium]|nr:MAG: hypothetical protein KatS3mg087_0666 [Patescibacteria group bacterium]